MITLIVSIVTIVIAGCQVYVSIYIDKGNKKHDIYRDTLLKCEYFQAKIIPQHLELMKFHRKNKLNLLESISFDKSTGILNKPLKLPAKWDVFLENTMLLFNEMDSFAAFITNSSLADINKAYEIQGSAFCKIINELKVVYDLYLTTNKDDYYCLENLYNQWSAKRTPVSIVVEYETKSLTEVKNIIT